MFAVGSAVSVKTKHKNIFIGRTEEYEVKTIKGKIVQTPHWAGPNCIAIMTGNPDFPVSIIRKSNIVGSECAAVSAGRAFSVMSKSSGKTYTVTLNNNQFQCDCIGFSFKRTCKHVRGVQKWIDSKNKA